MNIRARFASAALSAIVLTGAVIGQMPSPEERARIDAGNDAERNRELKLLGITSMQPGVTAYDIGKPGNANYDESKANPFPKLPELMTLQNGTKVKTRAQWEQRRKELKALFDEDVYGKFPAKIPSVSWTTTGTEEMTVAGVPAIVKHLVGHTDNSAYPAITVDIHADLVTPVSAKGKKVPVIIGGGSTRPRPVRPPAAAGQAVHMLSMPENPPDSSELLLKHGLGATPYQIRTRAVGSRYSVWPGWTANAWYQGSMLRTTSVRTGHGECGSVSSCWRSAGSRLLQRHTCAQPM